MPVCHQVSKPMVKNLQHTQHKKRPGLYSFFSIYLSQSGKIIQYTKFGVYFANFGVRTKHVNDTHGVQVPCSTDWTMA